MRTAKKENYEFDVVVIGGGLSGICAAIASARHGAKTALVQARPVLGGNASSEIRMHVVGATCHGGKDNLAETGILMELQLENKSRNTYHSFPMWDMVLWEKVRYQENLTLFMNTTMDSVEMDGENIAVAVCRQTTTEKEFYLKGKIFIDATGHGSLGYYAGAEYRMGSEGKAEHGEPDAPDEANANTMGNTVMFMASDRGEPVPFKKPFWAYDFTEDDLKYRPHGNYTWYHGENGVTEEYVPESGYWWVELGGDRGNIIDKAEEINEDLFKVVYGIWNHIKNVDHDAENYALDWVGAVPGIRESRRLVGDYLLTEMDVKENRIFEDAVAYGGWPMDEHAAHGVLDKDVKPTRYINFSGIYTIPYRSFCSKDVPNLMMAGRNISATKLAMGSTRVMGTCAIGGQAAGTAAAMAIEKGCLPREIGNHMKELQQKLLKDDCYIPGYRNEDPDDFAPAAKITATDFQSGWEPEKVVSGVARVVGDESNCWESGSLKDGPKTLTLAYDAPRALKQIRVTFDPNLSREIMISMTRSVQEREVKYMPLELVKDFTVRAYCGESCVFEQKVRENNQRLCVFDLDANADRVEITVESTYGYERARIFEVRLY